MIKPDDNLLSALYAEYALHCPKTEIHSSSQDCIAPPYANMFNHKLFDLWQNGVDLLRNDVESMNFMKELQKL